MRRLRYLVPLVVLAYLATGIAQVSPEERAVVRRFGRVIARPGPGLWVGLPWGIDQVDRIPVRTARQFEVGYNPAEESDAPETPTGQLLTGDQNLINLKLVLEYAVDERDAGLDDFVRQRDVAEVVLAREAESVAREWVAARSVDEVLLAGRAAIPQWVMARLPDRLAPHHLGVVVQRTSVDHLAPPSRVANVSVRDSFEAVNQAQTNIATREFQARQEAALRLRDALTRQVQSRQEGAAAARDALTRATADAEVFRQRLDQYRTLRAANPDVLTAIWWDETAKLLTGMKARGRIDLLDHHLAANGLDITQFVTTKKK